MNPLDKLNGLLQMKHETEVVEFKAASVEYQFDKIGKYLSALSNEANLRKMNTAWLVFGVEDKTHRVVGTRYRNEPKKLNELKHEIANLMSNRHTFREIYEVDHPDGRVILFEIPPAPLGIPIAHKGFCYAREGESLVALNPSKYDQIRTQNHLVDWSKEVIPDATIDDLDPVAIQVARSNFKIRNPHRGAEFDTWDDMTFLNKAKITIKGKITRTAIVLLGKSESEHYISPATTRIRWLLKDSQGNDRDYHIETCPFLLAIDRIYAKIRNVKYRYLPIGTLLTQEIETYEPFVIREAICNCIAHQDYSLGNYINVVEFEDRLVFSNRGSFLPGSVERVVIENSPEENYRNSFLVGAMFELNLIETRGGGIREMFRHQRSRFFPLPEYDLLPNRVVATITGRVLDETYAKILCQYPQLNLEEIIALDKVQKKKVLTPEEIVHLRKKKMIEGRKPNFFLAKNVAQKTGQKGEYSKLKGLDEQFYLTMIIDALNDHDTMKRCDIDDLLREKLPNSLTGKQKTNKITNLLSKLKKQGKITPFGRTSNAAWSLSTDAK